MGESIIISTPTAQKYYATWRSFSSVFGKYTGWTVMIYQATLFNDGYLLGEPDAERKWTK